MEYLIYPFLFLYILFWVGVGVFFVGIALYAIIWGLGFIIALALCILLAPFYLVWLFYEFIKIHYECKEFAGFVDALESAESAVKEFNEHNRV